MRATVVDCKDESERAAVDEKMDGARVGPRAWKEMLSKEQPQGLAMLPTMHEQLAADADEDRLPMPTTGRFIHYSHRGTIGRNTDGGIVVQDDGGLLVLDALGCDEEVDEILRSLAVQMKSEEHTVRRAEAFWKKQAKVAEREGIGFEVATMYKTKDKKVQPVHNSDVRPQGIEGRSDWKERALKARSPTDKGEQPFDQYFLPRWARWPRGQRLTKERLAEMKFGPELLPKEREMLEEMLYRREPALSFDFSESGRVHADVAPPVRIHTVPHEAWKEAQFPVPRMLRDVVIEMIQQRLDRGTLRYSRSPYRNPWFLVKKKDSGYRLINNAQKINKVTVRDANLPPNPDEFSEEFAGCHIVSLIDFFSGYDQIPLHEDSMAITAFATPLGLVEQCTLPMGTTNSVAEFVRVVSKILRDQIPHRCMPYMDDIAVKGPKTDYDGELLGHGIRRFVAEHIINLDRVLADMELAGVTASAKKSDWCFTSMGIVGYVIDKNGRHPAAKKVEKIVGWPAPNCAKDVRMFLGVCVYYRIWVKDFARVASPLFDLLRKGADFIWTMEASQAQQIMKDRITSAPALVSVDYSEPIREITIMVDGSKKGWGAVLQQKGEDGLIHPIRFESGVWSVSERNWDSGKHECKALLLALKKFRPWIYGVHFIVETDSKTLIAQLNRSATDVPGALITRWLALLNLWEFDIRHVAGRKNVVADALSRRPEGPDWEPPLQSEDDADEMVDRLLGSLRISATTASEDNARIQLFYTQSTEIDADTVLETLETSEFRDIAQWLARLQLPPGATKAERRRIRQTSKNFRILENILWYRASGQRPLRRVVDSAEKQAEIMTALHDESGHRGREGTWRKVAARYYWIGIYESVKRFVSTCEECQQHTARRVNEELHPTWGTDLIWGWVTVDVVYMPKALYNKQYLVVARDYTTGWPEAKALSVNDSESVAKFLDESIFSRWGLPYRLSVDGGPENKGLVTDLARQYGIERVVSSAYHPQGQGLIERGHKELVGALRKMAGDWGKNLHLALWADRVTVKRSTGETPAFLVCGREHILPIELSIPTWQTIAWGQVRTTEELLAARAQQFQRRDARLQESIDRTVRLREENKEWFDARRTLRIEPLQQGDLVLVWDAFQASNMSRKLKLAPRYKGPFRIRQLAPNGSGWYHLEDLDGTPFRTRTPGDRVVRFYQRETTELIGNEELEPELVAESGSDTGEVPERDEGALQEEVEEAVAEEGRSTEPVHHRRSQRLRKSYGQDIPRQKPWVKIPKAPVGFDRASYRLYR
jgi:hypothetical protein